MPVNCRKYRGCCDGRLDRVQSTDSAKTPLPHARRAARVTTPVIVEAAWPSVRCRYGNSTGSTRSGRRWPASTDHAVEWFAEDTGAVLGAIAYHPSDLAWSLVVMERLHDDQFHVCDRAAGLPALDDARRLLSEKMASALTTRQWASAHRAAA